MPYEPVSLLHGLGRQLLLAGVAIFATGFVARGLLSRPASKRIIGSPRKTLLLNLSPEEASRLPYPPDALPGARDVDSPYGSLRVYEWGPEAGRKAVLIHGISTPCLALGAVAHGLVDRGTRVIMFDLLGRGYSDTPSDLSHDIRLFTSQIFLALVTSPLSWTGGDSGGFAIIGYSLGGGIAASFTSQFPSLVNSLVLIAPSGIIRPYHFSKLNRIVYSEGVIPETILHGIVRRRLQTPLYPRKHQEKDMDDGDVLAPIQAEINLESNPATVLSKSHPDITIEAAVTHQVQNHEGFVPAFMSSIRNGPISHQHADWRRIGQRLTQQKNLGQPWPMKEGKVLVIGGSKDPIIVQQELENDASEVFEGNAVFEFIDAGHEVPVAHGETVAKIISEFWS